MLTDAPTILVVEDDPGVRHVIVSILRRATQFAIDDFESAAEACAAARVRPYGIAVLDIGMAPVDGIELAAQLEVLQPGLPIVFLTGSISDDRARADAMRPVAVLQKPADIRAVAGVVLEHARRPETPT
jgi:CheY-like chemotaxis protein